MFANGRSFDVSVRVEWSKDSSGRWKMEEVPGSAKFFPTQLVLLALGFLGPENAVIKGLSLKQDGRSNIQTAAKVSFISCGKNHG
jgi:glutamate synthase (NADPH/NADH)